VLRFTCTGLSMLKSYGFGTYVFHVFQHLFQPILSFCEFCVFLRDIRDTRDTRDFSDKCGDHWYLSLVIMVSLKKDTFVTVNKY
jgi:hypothetical protein